MTEIIPISGFMKQKSAWSRLTSRSGGAALIIILLAAGGPVFAQDESATASSAKPVDLDIVVTGTRVVRNGYLAPTPVTVLNSGDIARDAPTQVTDFIAKVPQFFDNITPRNSMGGIGDSNAGVSNLNLRSMGPNRTLVLLNGVRVGASSVTGFYGNGGSVDVSAFPDALISRIEVVTGGASASYGSDALVGVVNFVLDTKFTGLKATVSGGETTYGDDPQYLVNLTDGTKFAGDRGHFLISGTYNYNQGIPNGGSARAWVRNKGQRFVNPAYVAGNGQPFYLFRFGDIGSSVFIPGGLISSGPLKGIAFGPGGVPRQFVYGSLNDGASMIGGEASASRGALGGISFGTNASLDTELSRINLFSRASYELTDAIEIYGQFMFSRVKTTANFNDSSTTSTVSIDNPFIPASVKSRMVAAGVTSFSISTYNTFRDPYGIDNERRLYNYLAGAKGEFNALGSNWSWDLSETRSVSRTITSVFNDLILPNFRRAVDVVSSPVTGLPICRSTLTAPNDGCIPFNIMGTGVNSQSAIDEIYGTAHLNQTLTENTVAAVLHGNAFSTWAGPVSLAFGVEHRTESVKGTVSALDLATSFNDANYKPTIGSYHINEGFLETVVPLAKDMVVARAVDLNAALRVTDYSTSGKVVTWKVGGTWDTPIKGLRLRATRSRDIRSPNLGELFSGGAGGVATFTDPKLGGQAYPIFNVALGNPSLAPEKADTTGAGVVFQPSFVPGFSASIDYYKIKINNAIASVNAQVVLNLCAAGNQFYCSNITRDPTTNQATLITTRPGNTAFAGTSGLDFETSYTLPLTRVATGWNGSLSIRALVNRVLSIKTTTPDGVTLDGLGVLTGLLGSGNPVAPKWRYNVTMSYDTPKFAASWTGRGLSAGIKSSQYTECTANCPTLKAPYFTIENNRMPSAFYMDLSFVYHLISQRRFASDFTVSVENIVNKDLSGVPVFSPVPTFYDTLGRIFRASLRVKI